MPYRYGNSRGVVFGGAVITDNKPLVSPWAANAPAWQFEQYTVKSPAQSENVQYYPELERLKLCYVVFEAYSREVYRVRLDERSQYVILPTERMAVAASLYKDSGNVPETVETFAIKLFAPIGAGFYWFPRTLVWEFD